MVLPGDIDARLPLYTYLRPLIDGRRVLEIGGRSRPGAETLVRLGATSVVALVDDGALSGTAGSRVRWLPSRTPFDALISAGPFDVVIVPDAFATLGPRGRLHAADLQRLLTNEGHLVVATANGDRMGGPGAGFSYYDLQDKLTERFAVVRMFGQTPFAALGIAEFDAEVSDLRVDAELIDPDAEEPTHYVAVAGSSAGPALGYALVQVPSQPAMALPAAAAAPGGATANAELLQKLAAAEAEAQALSAKLLSARGEAEGHGRVARAQAEEIEELRARVRRAAETRVQLDDEIARLRKALSETDRSVLDLTRRTADEVSALAARLSSTLAPPVARPVENATQPAGEVVQLAERLRQREAQLAQRESALFDRDERIAVLEAEKQDLAWQLAAAEAAAAEGHVARTVQTPAGPTVRERELEVLLQSRDKALNEFRQAAIVHIQEVDRLRSAVGEQAAHVSELEEALLEAETRAATAARDAETVRASLAQSQEADRARRSRLSELEGMLLRMRHEANRPKDDDADLTLARRRVAELEARLAMLETALAEAERGRTAATARLNEAQSRLSGLEERTAVEREVVKQAQENVEQVARVAEQDVNRLRQALERSEDQLRKARGQLLPLRGRVAMLEREKEARDLAEREFARSLLEEVSAIEQGLRDELGRIADLSREVSEARLSGHTIAIAPPSIG